MPEQIENGSGFSSLCADGCLLRRPFLNIFRTGDENEPVEQKRPHRIALTVSAAVTTTSRAPLFRGCANNSFPFARQHSRDVTESLLEPFSLDKIEPFSLDKTIVGPWMGVNCDARWEKQ